MHKIICEEKAKGSVTGIKYCMLLFHSHCNDSHALKVCLKGVIHFNTWHNIAALGCTSLSIMQATGCHYTSE